MLHKMITGGIACLLVAATLTVRVEPSVAAQAQAPKPEELAAQVKSILERHCFECHGKDPKKIKGDGLKVLDRAILIDAERKLVVPKAPDDSVLMQKVEEDSMPPGKRPKVSKAERKLLREWIVAGAPDFRAAVPEPPGDALAGDLPGGNPVQEPAKPRKAAVRAAPAGSAAAAVKEVFRRRCFECHGGNATNGGVKILDHELLVVKKKKVVPGKPDESTLFQLVTAKDDSGMPPPGQARLNAEEIDSIRRWISEGAQPFPADVQAPVEQKKDRGLQGVIGVDYVLKQILKDVRSLSVDDRPYVRYFSINHVLTGGATNEELDNHRHALAKGINHLTWEKDLVVPRPIEPTNTVYAVDIRRLGWHKQYFRKTDHNGRQVRSYLNLFDMLLLEYPYGVIYEDSETFDHLYEEFLAPAYQVRPIPYVRADWFVSTATLPPLYEDFLQLPFTLAEFEKRIGIDSQADVDSYIAKRAGMTVSGVSRNNRVVERHPSNYGAYWKSFDFKTSVGLENMFKDPIYLNPAGGEMIFNLPNGLQGYFVTDGKGNRLEFAVTEIVTDKFAEDKTVRTGLSCIRCHNVGMKEFADNVRPAIERLPGSPGIDKRRTLQLYPEQKEMDQYLKEDGERFLTSMEKVLGKPMKDDPLIPVTHRFLDLPLPLTVASAELGLPEPGNLKAAFRLPQFASLGLVPLGSEGGVVKRDMWEDYYDQIVRYLGLGIPIVPIDGLTRRDFQPNPCPFEVELKTNKPGNTFTPGDKFEVIVTNKGHSDLYIELIGSSARGKKFILAQSTTVVRPRESYRWSGKVNAGVGKEQFILFACDAAFPGAQLHSGYGVVDRVVHPFYKLAKSGGHFHLNFDPARLVKKTLEIETR